MSSSDNEAPEEIALSLGKSQAETLRSQEQAQQKQHSHSKRKKRRTDDNTIGATASIQQTNSPREGKADMDSVPDEVIEALTAADRYGYFSCRPQHLLDVVSVFVLLNLAGCCCLQSGCRGQDLRDCRKCTPPSSTTQK